MTIDEIYINLCYSGMFKNIIGYYGKEKKKNWCVFINVKGNGKRFEVNAYCKLYKSS